MPSVTSWIPIVLAARPGFWFPFWMAIGAAIILGLVQLTALQRQSTQARIREALRLSDISLTKAALWMELHSASDLEKMLTGERKLDWWRLEMLPVAFHQHFNWIGLRDRGLPDMVRHAIKMAPAFRPRGEIA